MLGRTHWIAVAALVALVSATVSSAQTQRIPTPLLPLDGDEVSSGRGINMRGEVAGTRGNITSSGIRVDTAVVWR